MTNVREFSDLLAATAAELDIPDDLHEAASLKYEEVGVWFASEESSLVTYDQIFILKAHSGSGRS